ncbi:MAG: tRNA-uridine aminocarboxypropyltransferase [Polyangiales bacterium]
MKEASFREECARCGRPAVGCYCAAITPIETRTKVLILQHPREHEVAINTARIAALALPRCELVVGVELGQQAAVQRALADTAHPPVLLYPGPDARDLASEPPQHPVTLVVIDGTWAQARQLFRKNPWLKELPRYAFAPSTPSEYRIRREPRPDYVSTIEALVHALPHLEGDPARFELLLAPFRAMVEVQLGYAAVSTGGRKRTRRRRDAKARARLPDLLTHPQLVCATGEANAWPHDRSIGRPRHPHELVHWLALRLDEDAAPFERVVAPRLPLAASPMIHAKLEENALRAGVSVPSMLDDFARFSREGDVLCTWGHYAVDLFVSERGAPFETQLDLRKVAGDFLKRAPGSLEELVAAEELAYAPLGAGRGGVRLGMLAAVTRWLRDEACRERT